MTTSGMTSAKSRGYARGTAALAMAAAGAGASGCGNGTANGLAIGAGVTAGVGVLDVALTHSKLSVKVSHFNPKPTQKYTGDLTSDFVLNHKLMAQVLAERTQDPAASDDPKRYEAIRARIMGSMGGKSPDEGHAVASRPVTGSETVVSKPSARDRIEDLVDKLGKTRKAFESQASLVKGSSKLDLQTVVDHVKVVEDLNRKVLDAISEFDAAVDGLTKKNGSTLAAAFSRAREALLSLRAAAENASQESLPEEYTRLFVDFLDVELSKSDVTDAQLENVGTARGGKDNLDLVKTLTAYADFINASGAKRDRLVAAMQKVLDKLPLGPSAAEIVSVGLRGRVRELLRKTTLVRQLAEVNAEIVAATFDGFTTSISLGPISNEVMQMVTSQTAAISDITAPENQGRWQPFSEAAACAGAGDSTSVVYFENLATPVLKSSSFDPTKFIAAEGKIYRNTFDAIVDSLGAPVAAAKSGTGKGSSGTDTADGSAATPNIYRLRQQTEASKMAVAEATKDLLAAMKAAVEGDTTLKAETKNDANGTVTWTGSTPTADLSKVGDALDAAIKKLGKLDSP